MAVRRADDWFELSGGALCLDFANTVSDRHTTAPIERFETLDDWLQWASRAGLLAAAELRTRMREARRHPHAAARTLADVRDCREVIYQVCSEAAAGRDLTASLARFSTLLARILPLTTLEATSGAVRWTYTGPRRANDALLWPVLWSAAELLASDRRTRIRECEARDCGWLFLEASAGHRRRWCNMRICGNREKLRRFRAVTREMSE